MKSHEEYPRLNRPRTVDTLCRKMHNLWNIVFIGFIIIPTFRLTGQAEVATDSPAGKYSSFSSNLNKIWGPMQFVFRPICRIVVVLSDVLTCGIKRCLPVFAAQWSFYRWLAEAKLLLCNISRTKQETCFSPRTRTTRHYDLQKAKEIQI